MKSFEDYLAEIGEVGYVAEFVSSLVYATGLPKATSWEIVLFESGQRGMVTMLKPDTIEILLFSGSPIRVGTRIVRTGQHLKIGVGEELLGKSINALGGLMDDGKPPTAPKEERLIDVRPSGIPQRKLVSESCETGVSIVDLIVPLGKGQRELVIGDRKTGKTQFVLQAALTQVRAGSICVFACIGQNNLHIRKVEAFFAENKILDRVVLVASSANDAPGMIFLAPFTAMTIAEYFRDMGSDVLLVLDDLSTHAKFYREIALLGKRFPGRNSYPSDVFYTHARLLERAGNFVVAGKGDRANGSNESNKSNGGPASPAGRSITCLAVVETIMADITGYIQTNLMSITDGHIYFDSDLFYRGRRPAIHPFLSVTRLGRQTQNRIAHDINREIMAALSLFEKTQRYQRFGAELTEGSKLALIIGEFILQFFNQKAEENIPLSVQLASFALLWSGKWRDKGASAMKEDVRKISGQYQSDARVRKQIDELIAKSESFDGLLKNIRGMVWPI